jgi:tetratricopeptide (TPR) repeat protein
MPPGPPLTRPKGTASTFTVPQAMQRAVFALQRGESREAEQLCRAVLGVTADHFDALYLLAILAGQAGNPSEAAALLSRALVVRPTSVDAHYNHGVALGELGRPAEALASYDRAIDLRHDHADAHFNRGVALGDLGRPAEALESYERAIALKPGNPEAYNNRGVALSLLGRRAEALASYERAIALKPKYASAYNNLGNLLWNLERLPEALAAFDDAIASEPDYPEAHNNRGLVLAGLERHAEALAEFERAIALKPDYAEAHYDRGNALRELHRHGEAIESFKRAIALRPDYASAHWNLADCHLLLGEFAPGWQEYEWRWKLEQREHAKRDFPRPLWLGEQPIAGQTVLLHSEFGLGDTLLFCRYAKEVASLGARVILEVQPPLVELLSGLEGIAHILPRGAPLPAFDCHCPLMSLPLAFRTDLTSIPAAIPYIRSDPARVAAWHARLGASDRPRVGIVWRGSTALKYDRRSMNLAQMLPLVREGVDWISLQKEVSEEDVAVLASRPEIRHFGDELRDFADTAALIELTDLVVTIDTSVANLAGAMGKAVWILLPYNPHDWRWMLDREDSIWYPTARLFRQPTAGDWVGVIDRVKNQLAGRYGVGG